MWPKTEDPLWPQQALRSRLFTAAGDKLKGKIQNQKRISLSRRRFLNESSEKIWILSAGGYWIRLHWRVEYWGDERVFFRQISFDSKLLRLAFLWISSNDSQQMFPPRRLTLTPSSTTICFILPRLEWETKKRERQGRGGYGPKVMFIYYNDSPLLSLPHFFLPRVVAWIVSLVYNREGAVARLLVYWDCWHCTDDESELQHARKLCNVHTRAP